MSAISNIVTTGNGHFKMESCALVCVLNRGFRYGAITVAKVSLFSIWMRSIVSFHSMYCMSRNQSG